MLLRKELKEAEHRRNEPFLDLSRDTHLVLRKVMVESPK